MAGSSGQNVSKPGKGGVHPIYDSRTATPKGMLQHDKGSDGVGSLPIKSGGNPAGGEGGSSC